MEQKKMNASGDVTKNLQKMLKARRTPPVLVKCGSVRPPRARAMDLISDSSWDDN